MTNAPSNLITTRGYTGHEHIDEFNLINMNGRIYDPVLCRFISPDPFIANPSNSQDYNRYSYVLNNPLSYTDPTGYQKYSCEITSGMFWNDISHRGGGGSIFPKWGGLHGAHSRLEYDLMLAGNFDRASGNGTFFTNGVLDHLTGGRDSDGNKNGKSDGYYSDSDINRCLRDGILRQEIFEQTTDHWTAIEDENGTINFNGRKVRLTHYMGSTTIRWSEWAFVSGQGGEGDPTWYPPVNFFTTFFVGLDLFAMAEKVPGGKVPGIGYVGFAMQTAKSFHQIMRYSQGDNSINPYKASQDFIAGGVGTFLGAGGFFGGVNYLIIDKTVGVENYCNSFMQSVIRYGETGDPSYLRAWKR